MALSVKHKFTSPKADGTDSTLVKPSNWNDQHDITTDQAGVVLGRDTTGAGPIQELPYTTIFPTGVVLPFAGTTAPSGFLMCNGQQVLRADYPALFALIGTTWNTGTVDALHFCVPDMRGRVPAGVDGGTGRISAVVANTLGATGGQQQARATGLNGYVDVNVTVNVSGANWSDGTNFYYTGGLASAGAGSGAGSTFVHSGNCPVVYTPWSGSGSGSGSGTIRNDGNNYSALINTVQPTIAMNYIIRT